MNSASNKQWQLKGPPDCINLLPWEGEQKCEDIFVDKYMNEVSYYYWRLTKIQKISAMALLALPCDP